MCSTMLKGSDKGKHKHRELQNCTISHHQSQSITCASYKHRATMNVEIRKIYSKAEYDNVIKELNQINCLMGEFWGKTSQKSGVVKTLCNDCYKIKLLRDIQVNFKGKWIFMPIHAMYNNGMPEKKECYKCKKELIQTYATNDCIKCVFVYLRLREFIKKDNKTVECIPEKGLITGNVEDAILEWVGPHKYEEEVIPVKLPPEIEKIYRNLAEKKEQNEMNEVD